MNPELLLEEPKEVLLEPLSRPETQRENENAQAIAEREARNQLARDKILLENDERRAGGPKVGHNVYYNELQKRVASRLFLALGTEGEKICTKESACGSFKVRISRDGCFGKDCI